MEKRGKNRISTLKVYIWQLHNWIKLFMLSFYFLNSRKSIRRLLFFLEYISVYCLVIWNILSGSCVPWLLKNSILNGSIPKGAKFSRFLLTSPLLRNAGLTFQTSEGREKQHSFVFTLKFKTLSEKTSLSSQRLEEY